MSNQRHILHHEEPQRCLLEANYAGQHTSVHLNSVCLISDKGTMSLYSSNPACLGLDEKVSISVNTLICNGNLSLLQKLTFKRAAHVWQQPELLLKEGKPNKWQNNQFCRNCALKSMSPVFMNSSQPSLAHPKSHLQAIRASWKGRLFGERLFGHFAALPAQIGGSARCGTSYVLCFSSVRDEGRRYGLGGGESFTGAEWKAAD